MIRGGYELLDARSVANLLQRGGTILGTARSPRFRTAEGRAEAYRQLQAHGIRHIVAIGGDGTYAGAHYFAKEYPDLNIIGAPGTIDNDLYGTDYTIGYDTALNTVVEAVDKLRDTAEATGRIFLVEVMGRDAGCIALESGLAAGAEAILIPETPTDLPALAAQLNASFARGKKFAIIIVAEGDEAGGAFQISEKISPMLPEQEIRVTILGHLQRGGSPTCTDRVRASRLGLAAVEALRAGKRDLATGFLGGKISYTPLDQATKNPHAIDQDLIAAMEILAQ
jgi:6-phosphofructokinase 1